MSEVFLKIFDFFYTRKTLCNTLLVSIIAILLVMVSSLKYNEDIYDFIPVDRNQQKAVSIYQDISGGRRIVAMIKTKNENENSELLCEAVDTFTNKLKMQYGSKHLKEIISQVNYDKIEDITKFTYQHLPYILSDSDYVRIEQILNSDSLAENQMVQSMQMIMMPATGTISDVISFDPLGLFSPVFQRIQKRQSALPFDVDNGYIFTSDRQYAIVLITSAYGPMESANNTALVNFIDSVSKNTMEIIPNVEISITGSPVIAVDNASQIKKDSRIAITISMILILTLLFLSLRSSKKIFLIGFSVVFGWLFAMAFIAIFRNNVSLIVLGIGSIIIGIAVNYPLHFIAHMTYGGNARQVLKEMVSPLLIGNITTVGAFCSLIPLDAPALCDLGLFAASMLVGTILFVLIFLPHLVEKPRHSENERLFFGRLASMSPKIRTKSTLIIVLLTVVFSYLSIGTSFDSNMHHINYLTPVQQKLLGDLHISAGIKDTNNVYVVTEGNTWNEALEKRERLNPLIDSLAKNKIINSYSNVTSFICSENIQRKKIEQWNNFWRENSQRVRTLLFSLIGKYEFNDNAFDDFFAIINKKYSTIQYEDYQLYVSSLFSQSFSNSTEKCSVVDIVNVEKEKLSEVEQLINKNTELGYSFDFEGMNSAVANSLSDNFNYIGFACGLIVFIFLWISMGRIELCILAFLPMAIGWVWILGIMRLFDMQFNIVNVILATFIFGQGDDYTIFMADGLINEYAYKKKLLPSYKNSIIISALIMFIGMGSLIFAKHPALHSLGEVTIVGMLSVVLMSWIIPPMIFNWLTTTNNRIRHFPVTFEQIIRTLYCAIAYLLQILFGCILGVIFRLVPYNKEKKQRIIHKIIYKTMNININGIWGVKVNVHNTYDERFNRGSIIVCNHQSILDPILLLALNPNILILISDKVWKNPIVNTIFKFAGFIRLNQSMDSLKKQIANAISKGYNVVIFPEGKRNEMIITRFHRGAFYIAREIGEDILPVYIHGVGHVMPKGSGFATRGLIDVVIGKRISSNSLCNYGDTHQHIAKNYQKEFVNNFGIIRKRVVDTHYYHNHIINMYVYKGYGIEKDTKRLLNKYNDFSYWIDNINTRQNSIKMISILNSGYGQFALMLALVHPDIEVHSYEENQDAVAFSLSCYPKPENLHIHWNKDKDIECLNNSQKVIDLKHIFH